MPQLPKTRQSLLLRLGCNSDDAWSEFLEVYEQAIYTFARSKGLQDADAWDVTQEVLSAVEKKIDSWQADPAKGTFRGWLYRVARNIAIDKIHAQSKTAAGSGDSRVVKLLAEHPEQFQQETTLFWTNYRRRLLHWAAEQVKPDYKESSWQSFWLTSVEGKKPEDVAKELEVSVGSVYAAKFRIVSRIKDIVTRLDELDLGDDDVLNQFRSE
jgi:RNA polymerase sigma-70 factor (ECF subfamily)